MSTPLRLEATGDLLAGVEILLTAEQVGRILGVRTKRVYELGIPCIRIGRSVRFRPSDVQAWIEARRWVPPVAPRDEPDADAATVDELGVHRAVRRRRRLAATQEEQ